MVGILLVLKASPASGANIALTLLTNHVGHIDISSQLLLFSQLALSRSFHTSQFLISSSHLQANSVVTGDIKCIKKSRWISFI